MATEKTTLEFFGATTFRLRTNGITIFHDTWLDKPALMQRHLEIDDVTEADYILISHAHFDHLPGADRLAKRTGAVVIANCEAISLLRKAGVPDAQLVRVAGGERIPLFTRSIREQAAGGACKLQEGGPPGTPARPHPDLAAVAIHVWPSLHCLMPAVTHAEMPAIFDTGREYSGSAGPFTCTLDITHAMGHGLMRLGEIIPPDRFDEKTKAIADFMADKKNVMSACDGGQLMFNVVIGDKAVLFNSHLGAYQGIHQVVQPRPDVAVLGIAGRANLDGRPFDGSAAQFAVKQLQWLGKPEKVIWCLHDESLIPPFSVDTTAAKELVERDTGGNVEDVPYATPVELF